MPALGAPRRLTKKEKEESRKRRNLLRKQRYTQAREQTRPLDELDLDSVVDTIIDRMRNKYGVYTVEELDELERRPMQGKGRRLASSAGEEQPVGEWIAERRRRMEEGVRALPPIDPLDDEASGGGRRQRRPRRRLMKLRGGGTTYKSESSDPELESLKSRVEQMGAFLDEFFGPEGEPAYAGQGSTEGGEYVQPPPRRTRGDEELDELREQIRREPEFRPAWDPTRRGQPGVQEVTDQVLLDSYDEWSGHMAPGAQDVRDMIWAEIERRDIGHIRAEQQEQEIERQAGEPPGWRELDDDALRDNLDAVHQEIRTLDNEGRPHPNLDQLRRDMAHELDRRGISPSEPRGRSRRHREELSEEEVEGFNQYMADLREGTLRSERADMERGQRTRGPAMEPYRAWRMWRDASLNVQDIARELGVDEETADDFLTRMESAEQQGFRDVPEHMADHRDFENARDVLQELLLDPRTQARQQGAEEGRGAASWFFDGNTTDETYQRVRRGLDEGDPEILDMLPNPPSGEWADDTDILRELNFQPDDELAPEILDAFQDAFRQASQDEIERMLTVQGYPPAPIEPEDPEYTQAREQFYPHPLLGELSNEADPEVVQELLRRSLEGGLEGDETQAFAGGIAPVRSRRLASEGGEAPVEEEPEVTQEQLMEMIRIALAGHLMGGTVRRSAPLPQEPVFPQPQLPPIRPLTQPEVNPELAKLLLAFQQAPEEPRFPTPQLRPEGPLINPGINSELLKLLLGPLMTTQ